MSLEPKDAGGVDETSATIMIKAYTYNDLIYVQKFWDNLSMFDWFRLSNVQAILDCLFVSWVH